MSQLLTQLDLQTQRVRELAVTDELTGLPNRRAWNTELPQTIERVRRTRSPLSLAIVDPRHFKHSTTPTPPGDRKLKEAAAVRHDSCAPSTTWPATAGRNSSCYSRTQPPHRPTTSSTGCASHPVGPDVLRWCGHDEETSDELTVRADTARYAAKNAGRNQVTDADHHPDPCVTTTSDTDRRTAGGRRHRPKPPGTAAGRRRTDPFRATVPRVPRTTRVADRVARHLRRAVAGRRGVRGGRGVVGHGRRCAAVRDPCLGPLQPRRVTVRVRVDTHG